MCTNLGFIGCSAEAYSWKEVNTPEEITACAGTNFNNQHLRASVKAKQKDRERLHKRSNITSWLAPYSCSKHSDILIKNKKVVQHLPANTQLKRPVFWPYQAMSPEFSLHPHPFWSLICWVSLAFLSRIPMTKPCTCSKLAPWWRTWISPQISLYRPQQLSGCPLSAIKR